MLFSITPAGPHLMVMARWECQKMLLSYCAPHRISQSSPRNLRPSSRLHDPTIHHTPIQRSTHQFIYNTARPHSIFCLSYLQRKDKR